MLAVAQDAIHTPRLPLVGRDRGRGGILLCLVSVLLRMCATFWVQGDEFRVLMHKSKCAAARPWRWGECLRASPLVLQDHSVRNRLATIESR